MIRQTLTEDRSAYHCEIISYGENRSTLLCENHHQFDHTSSSMFEVYVIGDLREYGRSEKIHAAQLLSRLENEDDLSSIYKTIAGSFAVIVVDKRRNKLSVFNDHLASVPIYYSQVANNNYISTSLTQLIEASTDVHSFEISTQAIFHYIYFHCIPSPITIYNKICKLTPSQLMSFHEDGIDNLGTLYQPQFLSENSQDDRPQACLKEIEKAVNLSLPRNAVAAFLSGGLDSSTVAGMLKKLRGTARTFSIGFNEPGYDETEFAEISANHFGTDHTTSYLKPDYISNNFKLVASSFDEPFGNSSALAAFFCATTARQAGIDTLLAGDGGDELFAGNSRYAKQKLFAPYENSPKIVRTLLGTVFSNQVCEELPLLKKISSYVAQAENPLPDRLQAYNFLHRFAPEEVFSESFLSDIDRTLPLAQLRERYFDANGKDPTDRMLYTDWKFTLADNDLIKVKKMCELAGIDVKFPLVEKELVDFSCTIPAKMKLPGQKLRHFFKQSTSNFLASETLNKPKHGFGLPFGRWMRTNQDLIDTTESSFESMKSRDIFRPEFLDKALKMQSDNHAAYYGELIWVISVLEIWLQSREK